MKDDTRMRALMATALVLALAAMLAGPAGARPIDVDGTELTSSQAQAARPDDKGGPLGVGAIAEPKLVIPYLSQGKGVDAADFGGTGQAVDPTSVIPYLSNDWRVDESQLSGVENSQAATHPAPQSDDRTGWLEPTTFGVAIAGLLLGAMALLAMRRRHGEVAT
jgi:hypothetical protein